MKKFISILLSILVTIIALPVSAITGVAVADSSNVEHVKLPKKLAKKTPTDIVNNNKDTVDLMSYNTLQVTFANDFSSKTTKLGDEVVFLLSDGVYTVEGTEILPPATKLVAEVSNIEKPKAFNRSGKIFLDFKYVELPNGNQMPVQARIFGKNDFLSRGKLSGWGKGFGSAFGGTAVGTAAGCGIGIAANAVIIGGFAIGMPVGLAVGAAAGLLTPGLHYKAKAGDKVNIQLTKNLSVQKF